MAKLIDPERALGHVFPPLETAWTERDLSLYALATGAADHAGDDRVLRRVYERHPDGVEPLPGFFSVLALNALLSALREGGQAPGLHYGLERVLHAEEELSYEGPLRARGRMTHTARVTDLFDKGRHAVVIIGVESHDEAGVSIVKSRIASLVRGGGGFGGPRGEERPDPVPSDRAPDFVVSQATHESQALLFRLLGDDNPLHVDPRAARSFGLPRPILHGMCTLGYAMRHVADAAGIPAARVGGVSVRFSDVVFPGETLVTEGFRVEEGTIAFRVRVRERDRVVLSHGRMTSR